MGARRSRTTETTKGKIVDNSDYEEKAAALKGEIKIATDEFRSLREMQRKMIKERGEMDVGFNGARYTRAKAKYEHNARKLREYQANNPGEHSPRPPPRGERRRSTLTSDDKVKIAQRAINQEMDAQEAAESEANAEAARADEMISMMKKAAEKQDVAIEQLRREVKRLKSIKAENSTATSSTSTRAIVPRYGADRA